MTESSPIAPGRQFFVLALGRSGTAFLADLLDQAEDCVVRHEPYPWDNQILALGHTGAFRTVRDGMLRERFRRLLPSEKEAGVYGEVNSLLRYEGEWLATRLQATVVHLIRDGRDYVRSAFVRGAFTEHEHTLGLVPPDSDPAARQWVTWGRFEKLCWLWQYTNNFIARHAVSTFRFEQMFQDFDILEKMLLAPCGIRLSRNAWEQRRRQPRNTSSDFRWRATLRHWLKGGRGFRPPDPLPPYRNWTTQMKDTFWKICGETMDRFGYQRAAS